MRETSEISSSTPEIHHVEDNKIHIATRLIKGGTVGDISSSFSSACNLQCNFLNGTNESENGILNQSTIVPQKTVFGANSHQTNEVPTNKTKVFQTKASQRYVEPTLFMKNEENVSSNYKIPVEYKCANGFPLKKQSPGDYIIKINEDLVTKKINLGEHTVNQLPKSSLNNNASSNDVNCNINKKSGIKNVDRSKRR